MNKTVSITGMSCGHCATTVREALEKVSGVSNVTVNQKKGLNGTY